MFADPQVVTVNAVAKSMPRVKTDGLSAIYQMSDETFKLTLSHQKSNKRIRSMARIDQRAIVADPLTSENDYETLSFYVVIDRPEVAFSSTTVDQLVTGFKTWLDSTNVGKLYGQES
jgi:archaellum component FlaG (FlaF/FlaG flagellin family)